MHSAYAYYCVGYVQNTVCIYDCGMQFFALAHWVSQVMLEHNKLEELHKDHSKTLIKRYLLGGM